MLTKSDAKSDCHKRPQPKFILQFTNEGDEQRERERERGSKREKEREREVEKERDRTVTINGFRTHEIRFIIRLGTYISCVWL